MRLFLASMFALSLAACGTSGGGDDDDADRADASPDTAACTGAVYDACADTADSSDCEDGTQCHVFSQAGLTVCVPACDADNPCPDQDGTEVRCNNMGRCRPDVANECSLP
jgi:hypothetical protein